MELVYTAMLLHKAGKEINEANVKKVADAAGLKVDDVQIKALCVALQGVDIEKAIKEAAVVSAPAGAAPAAGGEAKKEAPKEEKKSAEESAAGLSSLFG
ncbi:MAG: 50S ribosomal protein P1 [Nanoarchaeota archaeon]